VLPSVQHRFQVSVGTPALCILTVGIGVGAGAGVGFGVGGGNDGGVSVVGICANTPVTTAAARHHKLHKLILFFFCFKPG